jgi:acyl-CoA reductase-like NAD-dependent aldehyde dehydrogenase
MNRFRVSFLIVVLLAGALLFSQTPQWSKEAQKLANSLKTLNTLVSINPFPGDVPGLNTAIVNKTGMVMDDLGALSTALQNEVASLSAEERQEALNTLAELMAQTADEGNRLAVREFDTLTLDLVSNYNTVRATYYSLAQQYVLVTQQLPIGTQLNNRGSWIPG